MGAKNSRLSSPRKEEGETTGFRPGDPACSASSTAAPHPTPSIEAPYSGPWAEYQFVDVTVPVVSDVAFCDDVKMTSSQSRGALAALEAVYGLGYSLVTFCRLPVSPGSSHGPVFVPGRQVQYQGILCRYEGDPGNEGWNLRAEKTLLLAHQVTPGLVSAEAGPGAQHVQRLISRTVQTGGRLLTVQWSALGVDVFFEVPDQSLPERSVYQLVTAPAAVVKRSLFASKGHLTCDWNGILTRHLARGWRLVDVFCEFPSGSGMSVTLSSASAKIQTVWFFEKPESRARDDCPMYEGFIVEHWFDASFSSSSSTPSPPLVSGGAGSCLGVGRGELKRSGGSGGKKSFTKRMASLRKKDDATKADDQPSNSEDLNQGGIDKKRENDSQTQHVSPSANETPSGDAERQEKNHINDPPDPPTQTIPSQIPTFSDNAGWESVIRSMGEKGWELASIINTMEYQAMGGRSKVKVLLVFQRKISLAMTVKGRRTSDGLALRADTGGASTSGMCDIPMMTGETSSHLNPSLAVRLPLSRSTSREHVDYNTSYDDDIPSTIGGGSCDRTLSVTDLSISGRCLDTPFVESGRGSGDRSKEESLLPQPKGCAGDELSRSSTASMHSRVTAAEIHITSGAETSQSDCEGKSAERNNDVPHDGKSSELNSNDLCEGKSVAANCDDLSSSRVKSTGQQRTDAEKIEEIHLQTVKVSDLSEGSTSRKSTRPDSLGPKSKTQPVHSLQHGDVTSTSDPDSQQQEKQLLDDSKEVVEDILNTVERADSGSIDLARESGQSSAEKSYWNDRRLGVDDEGVKETSQQDVGNSENAQNEAGISELRNHSAYRENV